MCKFIEGVDYRYSGGLGARDYYDENNGYIYRWDVQHNIGDLVSLIGGNEVFSASSRYFCNFLPIVPP